MDIKSLKDLKALLKLLREQGVQNYNTPSLQLVLNDDAPVSYAKTRAAEEPVEDEEDQPTLEEIEAYIAGTSPKGVPEI